MNCSGNVARDCDHGMKGQANKVICICYRIGIKIVQGVVYGSI